MLSCFPCEKESCISFLHSIKETLSYHRTGTFKGAGNSKLLAVMTSAELSRLNSARRVSKMLVFSACQMRSALRAHSKARGCEPYCCFVAETDHVPRHALKSENSGNFSSNARASSWLPGNIHLNVLIISC
jgi:hypothetical protein